MADPWYSEIELQKVFSLSPGEAHCLICVRNGLSVSEISDLTGQSVNTIRTLLRRGGQKMKKTAKTCTIIMLKGNKDVEGVLVKQNAIEVLARFAHKVYDTDLFIGDHSIVITGMPMEHFGNPMVMNETVFRKADIYGTTNSIEAENRAEKLNQAYQELDQGRNIFGIAVIRYCLDKMLVKYDVMEG